MNGKEALGRFATLSAFSYVLLFSFFSSAENSLARWLLSLNFCCWWGCCLVGCKIVARRTRALHKKEGGILVVAGKKALKEVEGLKEKTKSSVEAAAPAVIKRRRRKKSKKRRKKHNGRRPTRKRKENSDGKKQRETSTTERTSLPPLSLRASAVANSRRL